MATGPYASHERLVTLAWTIVPVESKSSFPLGQQPWYSERGWQGKVVRWTLLTNHSFSFRWEAPVLAKCFKPCHVELCPFLAAWAPLETLVLVVPMVIMLSNEFRCDTSDTSLEARLDFWMFSRLSVFCIPGPNRPLFASAAAHMSFTTNLPPSACLFTKPPSGCSVFQGLQV